MKTALARIERLENKLAPPALAVRVMDGFIMPDRVFTLHDDNGDLLPNGLHQVPFDNLVFEVVEE